MRIGTALPQPPNGDITAITAALREAAEDGLSSAWLTDPIFGIDPLVALAVAAQTAPDIEIGTAVMPTYFRHPVTLAREAITLDIATGGRFTLGIGLSHKVMIEGMLHIPFDRPAQHMADYLAILRPLIRDGAVAHDGDMLSAHAEITFRPIGPVPVLLAALAPRMVHLAGAVADGTIVWMTGPRVLEERIIPAINQAAVDNNRPAPRIVCIAPVCVTDNADAARDRAAKVFNLYDTLPSYKAMLDQEGASGPADVAIVGSADEVRDRIAHFAAIGVTDFVAGQFAHRDDRDATRALLRELAAEDTAGTSTKTS